MAAKNPRRQWLLRYQKHRQRNLLAKPGVHQFVILLDHLKAGFNVPKIFRSAQAFGARAVYLIGIDPFDPSPAKGAFKAVPARFYDNFDASYAALSAQGYRLFTLEPRGDIRLSEARLPVKSAFIFGHEELGLSFDPQLYPDIQTLTIPQCGQIESLNVSVAASIVMYEYVRQQPSRE